MSRNETNSNKKKGLIAFLTILVVFVIIAIIGIFGIIFFNLMGRKQEADQKIKTETTPSEEEVTEEESTQHTVASVGEPEEEIVANGDAAGVIDPDSWMAGLTIYDPQATMNTIHLQKADLSVFTQQIEDSSGNDTSSAEEGAAVGAWDLVTLKLPSVDGSINYSTPGDPTKTQQMTSTYMILVDLDTNEIVAERDCEKVVSPASMTKILTVMTARDFIDETTMNDTFVITEDITEYVRKNDCSAVGFLPGDEVTVTDLLYGTILPSGADAAKGLARFCCGSEEAFVDAMNKKVEELGLSETAHFTNVVGMYDSDLHCTMKDMSVILGVAVQDDILRDVLSARTYTTTTTYEDLDMPDGITVSNWFLRKIEDKDMNGTVVAAKTGFVNEAGCCAASYYEADNGKRYVCVTGNSFSSWRTIYDHLAIYRSLVP